MSTEYGKDLLADVAAFDLWVKKTTGTICNLNCEDPAEIAELLRRAAPTTFPCVIVWWYKRHNIFVESVYLSDFQSSGTDISDSPDSAKGKGGAK